MISEVPDNNEAPVLDTIGNKQVKIGATLKFTISASDINKDRLLYSVVNLPQGAEYNANTREFTWMPKESQVGTYYIDFSVNDGELTDTEKVKISVNKVPLESIAIISKPTKLEYLTEDVFKMDGLVVEGTFTDNDKLILSNITTANIKGYDKSRAGNQTLTVEVEGKTATFTINVTQSPLIPLITVLPGNTVKVNQEVFFTGEGSRYEGDSTQGVSSLEDYTRRNPAVEDTDATKMIKNALYRWDFGDGYTLNGRNGGIATTHYYMKPGTYTVKMSVSVYPLVTDANGSKSVYDGNGNPKGELIIERTVETQITVEGIEPLAGFEILHAPFTPRIGQKIIAQIPESVTTNQSNRLLITLTGDNGTKKTLFEKTGLQANEEFVFMQDDLPAGEYTFLAQLFDSNGNVITSEDTEGIWSETYNKPYDGIPKVGINEWNAICVNGEPFFPVTPFMTNSLVYDQYEGAINAQYQMGWYWTDNKPHAPWMWSEHLIMAEERNWMWVGPGRGYYTSGRIKRNFDLIAMQEFIKVGAASNQTLMYEWCDEPNLGGHNQKVAPSTLAAWKYNADLIDGEHPTLVNLYGQGYMPYYGTTGDKFDYINSNTQQGRHSFYADILTMDIYPLFGRKHASTFNKEDGVMSLWATSIDTMRERNMGLVPFGAFTEVCRIRGTDCPGPTHNQVLMESWIAVTHGIKMINWFPFFAYDTIQYEAMREFMTAINTYDKIILSRDDVPQITDNCNVRTNRVDSMTRKDGNDTYLFAVRVTEPEAIEGETINALPENQEPDSITTKFAIPGMTAGTVEILDETGKVLSTKAVVNGSFNDSFGKEEYKIYRISENGSGNNDVLGDTNGDGRVDIVDLAFIAKNMDKTSESSDWETVKIADMDGNSRIDIVDISTVAKLL